MNDKRLQEIAQTCGFISEVKELVQALRLASAREAKLKETIIEKLNQCTKNMENYGYFGKNMGVSEDDYEEVADAVCEALKETKP